MCVLLIKVPIRKKSENLFNDPGMHIFDTRHHKIYDIFDLEENELLIKDFDIYTTSQKYLATLRNFYFHPKSLIFNKTS